ncbi:MAG: hypothetical protein H6623_03845 [Bdellovibrionaceae bacterium]|nr:hypothetical protein [Pseudobdellovibrionaceae bacterium]
MQFASLLLFLSFLSPAEYRVYQLKITDVQSKKSREVLSPLMPAAYIVYYPIRSTEMVEILDHWMCWERSDGFKKPCTRPSTSLPQSQKTGSQE